MPVHKYKPHFIECQEQDNVFICNGFCQCRDVLIKVPSVFPRNQNTEVTFNKWTIQNTWDEGNSRLQGTISGLVTLVCAHFGSLEMLNLNAGVARGSQS